MKVDISDDIEGGKRMMSHFIIELISDKDVIHVDPKAIDVEVRICGREVDPFKFVAHIEAQMDRMIDEAIEDRIRAHMGRVEEIGRQYEYDLKRTLTTPWTKRPNED